MIHSSTWASGLPLWVANWLFRLVHCGGRVSSVCFSHCAFPVQAGIRWIQALQGPKWTDNDAVARREWTTEDEKTSVSEEEKQYGIHHSEPENANRHANSIVKQNMWQNRIKMPVNTTQQKRTKMMNLQFDCHHGNMGSAFLVVLNFPNPTTALNSQTIATNAEFVQCDSITWNEHGPKPFEISPVKELC